MHSSADTVATVAAGPRRANPSIDGFRPDAARAILPAVAKHATVDEYIAALPEPQRTVANRTRHVIDENLQGAESAIRWAHPTWSLGKTPVCYLKAASRHVTFGFWHGASIDDPSGRLESPGEVMAHVKLRNPADVDPKLFARWLKQARTIELSMQ